MFVDEGGAGALHWQRGPRLTRLNSGGIQSVRAQRRSLSVDRCGTSEKSKNAAGRTDAGVRVA